MTDVLREAAKWLHAAYDRPPQTPEAAAMLARIDAALAASTVQPTERRSGKHAIHPNEDDPVVLWAEISHLRNCLRGPEGYETWQDAAIDERMKRVKAEQALAALSVQPTDEQIAEAIKRADPDEAARQAVIQPTAQTPSVSSELTPSDALSERTPLGSSERSAPGESTESAVQGRAPITDERWQKVGDAIEQALLHYRCSRTVAEDGEPFPLLDKLCAPETNSTESGTAELELLTDAVLLGLHDDCPWLVMPEPPPTASGCGHVSEPNNPESSQT